MNSKELIKFHDWCVKNVDLTHREETTEERVERYLQIIEDRYPMCSDQDAQIDCRVTKCKYHINAECTNISPAITLNPENKTFVCWSKIEE